MCSRILSHTRTHFVIKIIIKKIKCTSYGVPQGGNDVGWGKRVGSFVHQLPTLQSSFIALVIS